MTSAASAASARSRCRSCARWRAMPPCITWCRRCGRAGGRTHARRPAARLLSRRVDHRRAEDPRHGDHRRAGADRARPLLRERSASSASTARWTPTSPSAPTASTATGHLPGRRRHRRRFRSRARNTRRASTKAKALIEVLAGNQSAQGVASQGPRHDLAERPAGRARECARGYRRPWPSARRRPVRDFARLQWTPVQAGRTPGTPGARRAELGIPLPSKSPTSPTRRRRRWKHTIWMRANAAMRITLTRGPGQRGLLPPEIRGNPTSSSRLQPMSRPCRSTASRR